MTPTEAATFEALRAASERSQLGGVILPDLLDLAARVRRTALATGTPPDRGTVAVATLAGDAHHIGAALLVALLGAAGYRVVDLGRQVPVEAIVAGVAACRADALALSALLISTSRQMPRCIQALDAAGLHLPVLLGGAAINRGFGQRAGWLPDGRAYTPGVFYCRDVFEGIATLEALADPARRPERIARARAETEAAAATYAPSGGSLSAARPSPALPRGLSPQGRGRPGPPRSMDTDAVGCSGTLPTEGAAPTQPRPAGERPRAARVRGDVRVAPADVPRPPFWGARRVEARLPDVWQHLDRNTLFRHHWGGHRAKGDDYERIVREVFEPQLRQLQIEAVRDGWLAARIVAGYWPCRADGNQVRIFDPMARTRELARLDFPRQPDGDHLCLADFFHSDTDDVIALQAVSTGPRAGQAIEALLAGGAYVRMLLTNGLAAATAEALAEYAHSLARRELGLQASRGLRFSWGYAACPDLDQQRIILPLLDAEGSIGLRLSPSSTLDPEHSTAAMIVHHPAVSYFAVRGA